MRRSLWIASFLLTLPSAYADLGTTSPQKATAALGACKDGKAHATLSLVLNGATAAANLAAAIDLPHVQPTIAPQSIGTGDTKRFIVSFDLPSCDIPKSPLLSITGSGNPLTLALTFKPDCKGGDFDWKALAFCGAPGISIVILGVCMFVLKEKLGLPMGNPQWDFTASWATNITLGGGLLGTILAFSAFPDDGVFLDKAAYLTANMIFPLIAGLAPQAFNIFRKPVDDPKNPTGILLQGYVFGFIIAASITAWAAIGQTAVSALAIAELCCAGYVNGYLSTPLIALLMILLVALVIYIVSTVISLASHQHRAAGLPLRHWFVP